MQLDVVNNENKKVGTVDVNDEVFGGRINGDLMWESVVHANAADRSGTHAAKTRAFVSGTGKKPWKQKGTGRAQVGSSRTPLWRHGGTVHPPRPRSYDFKLSKKVELGALRAALSEKMKAGEVIVVDALAAAEVKTKAAVEMLKRLGDHRQGGPGRRRRRREAVALGAQHSRRVAGAERAADRARRDRRRPRGGDPQRAREAAGGAGMKLTDVIRRPLITEKTSLLREDGRTIVFEVATAANKIEVKRAIEQLLGAKVESIRTSISHGKIKRQGRFAGRRSDWKKAYVKLREGAKMPEFLEGA